MEKVFWKIGILENMQSVRQRSLDLKIVKKTMITCGSVVRICFCFDESRGPNKQIRFFLQILFQDKGQILDFYKTF